ncbi:MAG: fructose-bisphosphatase class III [Bacteroidia bacterium]|nr:MAG: fructose-bisphosphatase class III [Bacteroidia bacterium]
MEEKEIKFLELLSEKYPSIQTASAEIINLSAIMGLPKGTEHFMSDIHGEYESFIHILNNASGVIRRRIDEIFKHTLTKVEKAQLATLIYYPIDKLELMLKGIKDKEEWYKLTLHRLIKVCKYATSKYTRSKVRKALPKDFAYIIEELLHESEEHINKQQYYDRIIDSIVSTQRANAFIDAICSLIRRMVIDRLHIVGDVFDRGPSPDKILDVLMQYQDIDFQWGNHDALWMGAALGCKALVATVLRICARYDNLDTVEDGYGINIYPLASLAMEYYKDDPCEKFQPKLMEDNKLTPKQIQLVAKMQKAIAIIQFKLEAEIIKRNPEFEMENRLLLDKIDYKKGTIVIEGKEYPLNDKHFPTIDPKNPYQLNDDEEKAITRLTNSFKKSEKLQKHTKFLFDKGDMFLVYNNNLLYHGCIPLDKDGNFKKVKFGNKYYSGKSLVCKFDEQARKCYSAFRNQTITDKDLDLIYYLWPGPYSPLFGKKKMATFERYFINDKTPHKEETNPYFYLRDKEEVCNMILTEFGLDPDKSHIVNGHMPVKLKKGESPLKGNGKMIVIDGGLAKAYQPVTGNAGYTLIYNSYGLILAAHKPFSSRKKAIEEDYDIISSHTILEQNNLRIRVRDTDNGKELQKQIQDLNSLLAAYRKGVVKEKL